MQWIAFGPARPPFQRRHQYGEALPLEHIEKPRQRRLDLIQAAQGDEIGDGVYTTQSGLNFSTSWATASKYSSIPRKFGRKERIVKRPFFPRTPASALR